MVVWVWGLNFNLSLYYLDIDIWRHITQSRNNSPFAHLEVNQKTPNPTCTIDDSS